MLANTAAEPTRRQIPLLLRQFGNIPDGLEPDDARLDGIFPADFDLAAAAARFAGVQHSGPVQPTASSITNLSSSFPTRHQVSIVTRHLSSLARWLVCCLMLDGTNAFAMPSPIEVGQSQLTGVTPSGLTKLAQTQPPQAPASPAAPATAPSPTPTAAAEPVGNVATLTGTATVIRNRNSLPLKLQDDISQDDVLQTSPNSTLGVTLTDATP